MFNRVFSKALASAAALAVTFGAANAFALDTTEVLDQGVIEVAPTLSLDNLHDGKPGFSSELVVGYGITDFFTINAGISASNGIALTDTDLGANLQLLFTPLNTENVDLDFMVDFDFHGDFGSYSITPSFELNFDTDDDMSFFGAYLRFALPIYSGIGVDGSEEVAEDLVKTDIAVDLALGMYISFVPDQQLFLEGGFTASNLAEKLGESGIDGGYVALGYNFSLFENFELTTEVKINIPEKDSDDDVSAALAIGGVFDFAPIH